MSRRAYSERATEILLRNAVVPGSGYLPAPATERDPPMDLTPGLFEISSVQGPYEGWTSGERWNGWACPYFSREVGLKIAADYTSSGPCFLAEYDAEEDCFRFYDPDHEEWEAFGAMEVGTRQVYPIGTHFWTWIKVEEPALSRQ